MQMCLSLSPPTCGSFLDSCLQTPSAFSDVELPRVFGGELKETSSAEVRMDLGEKISLKRSKAIKLSGSFIKRDSQRC